MTIKPLEIRDRGTMIGVLAIKMSRTGEPVTDHYLWYYGYPEDASQSIVVMRLTDQKTELDPFNWGGRTMPAAHTYIIDHFEELEPGDVVDVEVALGEKPAEETKAPDIIKGHEYIKTVKRSAKAT